MLEDEKTYVALANELMCITRDNDGFWMEKDIVSNDVTFYRVQVLKCTKRKLDTHL